MTIATDRAEPRPGTVKPRPPADERRDGVGKAAAGLTWLAAALAVCASPAGLLIDDVYAGAISTAEMFCGFDLVTAVVVVPGLVVALPLARRGAVRAQLITASLVAYLVYTYAYYLFGTGFNDLFLLHAAVFAGSVPALVLTLAAIDVASVADRFHPRTPVRVIGGILATITVALAGMWIYFAVTNAITGGVPAGSRLVETDAIVHLGMALDLSLLVPLYAVAAVLLWRRAAWGYVLAAVALFAGILHQVSYLVAMPFQAAANLPGAVSYDPAEPLIVLLYLVAALLLLRGAGPTSPRSARPARRSR